MVGWHQRFNGHEFEQAPGDGEGQGSLACCSPWGWKELDMTERLNSNKIIYYQVFSPSDLLLYDTRPLWPPSSKELFQF